MQRSHVVVVFDLDETLGDFAELSVFWNALQNIYCNCDKYHLFELIKLFPEFLRPDIQDILSYLVEKKRQGICDKLMIFTNNQGPRTWVEMITEYFNYMLDTTVFDHIIAAFKVNGKVIEWCRKSNDKNVDDLIKCSNIPGNTHICFIDDQEHPLMITSNVYYINVKPFHYSLSYKDMINRYYDYFIHLVDKNTFCTEMTMYMHSSNYKVIPKSPTEIALDGVISKQLLHHLQEFFIHSKQILKLKRKNKTVKKNRLK